MAQTAKAEQIIEDVAGCGNFQIIFYMAVIGTCSILGAYITMFMAFGSYNPGWTCRGNVTEPTHIATNQTALSMQTDDASTGSRRVDDYIIGSCEDYQKCDDVEFNPTTSTIVTEWGLLCDKSWIISTIISVQMLGMLVGGYLGGQLSDLMGRKKSLWSAVLACCICQLISPFSISWVMFMSLRFVNGASVSTTIVVCCIYIAEFMTIKWRAVAMAVPFWILGSVVLTLICWITEDWQKVEYVGCALGVLSFLTIFTWAPESLRWLEVNNKRKEFIAVSRKIQTLNKKDNISFEEPNVAACSTGKNAGKKNNVLDLFRSGYRMITLSMMFVFFSCSLLFYALTFGAKSLYGNFYLNMFLLNLSPSPTTAVGMFLIIAMTRRHYVLLCMSLTALFSVASVVILLVGNEEAKNIGNTLFVCMAKATLDACWTGFSAFNTELYPTVVRGVAVGLTGVSARVGGIMAPFLVPEDKDQFYIFMIFMTALAVIICVISYRLPETKGKVLKETFEDSESNNDNMGDDESKDDARNEQVL